MAQIKTNAKNKAKIRRKLLCTSLDRDMIIKYFQKDMDALYNKSPEDLKKIIQTYVEKVEVYQDYGDINLIVHTNGGGDESRTRVRNRIHKSFSGCISCF